MRRGEIEGKFFRWRGDRFRAKGVTYGPFRPDESETHFPTLSQIRADFGAIASLGINTVRVYHPPPPYLYEAAADHNLALLIDIPWPKHLCFLDDNELKQQARDAIRSAVRMGARFESAFAYSIGNEIPPNIVRWHGAKRVEQFLKELYEIAKDVDPEGLVTYANYPSTEYLQLPFLDFLSFNVYLHDDEAFSSYLLRLQNLSGDLPLVLSELGMDTLRHSQDEQRDFLEGHLKLSYLLGLAGAFVFSWTDEWFTGGFDIEDWAFGITTRDRTPKLSCDSVSKVFNVPLYTLLSSTPRVSVVVCSYNGASTLDSCLTSLKKIDYPDYEVILVDDGSTDNTLEIAARHPTVRTIHQKNLGLSVARNVGLAAASGSIIAYTDSDCFVDPDWLTLLVAQLERTEAVGVGGPNLTPADGWMASCVSACPGQPTHVLENDYVAEHVPGCNMAFYANALHAIGGFHPQYKKAGDDVDVCWRLQHTGQWISFAPGAFVWHQRRQTPKAYLRQQQGYGEAEALLWYDHPHKFNRRGESMWRGAIYGGSGSFFPLGRSVIYRGTFCSGMFQTLYQPDTPYWISICTSLEWHILWIASLLAFITVGGLFPLLVPLLALPPALALVRAFRVRLPQEHDGVTSRLLVALLSYLQPLVRSWSRYKKKLLTPIAPADETDEPLSISMGLIHPVILGYWDEKWRDRTELLEEAVRTWEQRGWVVKLDAGWSDYDVEVYGDIWSVLRICTVQEDHGSGKRLIRARFSIRPSHYSEALLLVVVLSIIGALTLSVLPPFVFAALIGIALSGRLLAAHRNSARAVALFDLTAQGMGMVRIEGQTSSVQKESDNDGAERALDQH